MTRDRDDRELRLRFRELPRRLDAVEHRHLDVHHDRVRLEALGQANGVASVARAADELEPPVGAEDRFERVEEVFVVFGDEDPVLRFRPHWDPGYRPSAGAGRCLNQEAV